MSEFLFGCFCCLLYVYFAGQHVATGQIDRTGSCTGGVGLQSQASYLTDFILQNSQEKQALNA